MTETVLFVGGVLDGTRKVLHNKSSKFLVPVRRGVKTVWAVGDSRKCDIECERYNRVAPNVYLISTKSPDNLIPLLIEGYRRAKK